MDDFHIIDPNLKQSYHVNAIYWLKFFIIQAEIMINLVPTRTIFIREMSDQIFGLNLEFLLANFDYVIQENFETVSRDCRV